ncbi:amidase [Novosphingobium resinovorum]|uniref:amidase n=1 Tax=Novosphingobium resinovorum TaxID=158500 RepID=UPI002ED1D54D|nr:amidase [Novosphingobium resinovorum]
MNIDNPIFAERYPASDAGNGTGLTVGVKDCIDIAGRRTTCGSRAFAQAAPAAADAAVVKALVNGGCRILGKTTMHELAYGMTGINGWTGTVENPRYPGLIAGGSSSGSAAAVAAGLVDIALGSDTGGSIRLPAACCGVIGLKPTFGRVSREGVHPQNSSQDCVGVFASSLDLVDQAMALIDPAYVVSPAPAAVRVGIVAVAAEPEITEAVDAALEAAGSHGDRVPLYRMEDAFQAGVVLMAAEAYASYGHLIETGLLGADVEARLRAAPDVASAERVAWAEGVRRAFSAAVDRALEEYDVLAMPTLPAFPPELANLGDPAAVLRLSALVRPFNLSGHPAISLPLQAPSGRPCAMQLVARHGDDARLCGAARALSDPLARSEAIPMPTRNPE